MKRNYVKFAGALALTIILILTFFCYTQERTIAATQGMVSDYKNFQMLRMKIDFDTTEKSNKEIASALAKIAVRMETLFELFAISNRYYGYKENNGLVVTIPENKAINFFYSYSQAVNLLYSKYEENNNYDLLEEYNDVIYDINLICDSFGANSQTYQIKDNNTEEINKIITELLGKIRTKIPTIYTQ